MIEIVSALIAFVQAWWLPAFIVVNGAVIIVAVSGLIHRRAEPVEVTFPEITRGPEL